MGIQEIELAASGNWRQEGNMRITMNENIEGDWNSYHEAISS